MSYVPSAFLVTRLCPRHRHTRHCPWVCTCSSRVILLTRRITAGGIALPFGKKLLSGKRVWIPGRVSPGEPLPCKQNHILPHLSRLSKGTVRPRAAPCKGGGMGSQRSRGPWPCPPAAQSTAGAQEDEAKVVICSHGEITTK